MKLTDSLLFKLFCKNVFLTVTLAVLYFSAAKASFLVATTAEHSVVTPIFYAAEGIALAATIIFGSRAGIGVFLGEFAFVFSDELAFIPACMLGIINAFEAIIGGRLFKRWQLNPALTSVQDFTALFVLIIFILQPLSATLGNLVLFANEMLESNKFISSWFSWWSANVMGQCLITPLILTIVSKPSLFKKHHLKLLFPFSLLIIVCYFIFEQNVSNTPIALTFIIPLLLWIAYRGNLTFVCISGVFITLLAIHGTSNNKGIFSIDDGVHLVELNVFILGLLLTAQFISVLITEITNKITTSDNFPISEYNQLLSKKQKRYIDLIFLIMFVIGSIISFHLEKEHYKHEKREAAIFASSYSFALENLIKNSTTALTINSDFIEKTKLIFNSEFTELYDYQVIQFSKDNSDQKIIYNSKKSELTQSANIYLTVFDRVWMFSVKPKNGYSDPIDIAIKLFVTIFIALLASQLAKRYLIVDNQKRTYLEHHFAIDKAAIFAETDSQGVITFVNEHFCRISGYSKEELIGSTYSLVKSDIHTREFYENLWTTIKSARIWREEMCNRHKNGTLYWVNAVIVPILSEDGHPKKYITIRFDITDRKKSEQRQIELTKQVNQMQKVESLSRLTSGIAHDFNNILNAIVGYNELNRFAGEDCTDKKLKQEILFNTEQVSIASERAVNLIKKMMIYSRQDMLDKEMEVKPTYEVIDEVLNMVRPALTSKFRLNAEVDSTLTIEIDSTELHQILTNLIVNARDAMKDGGLISISLKKVTTDKLMCHACIEIIQGEFIELSVSDNGTGIEESVITRIFDPFFTTKELGEGTGLGLSTVSGMVHDVNGHIIVESKTTEPNRGTAFKLFFPQI